MCIICTESILQKEIMWSEREKSFTLWWQETNADVARSELYWKARPVPPQFMCCYFRQNENKPSPNFSFRKIMKMKESWFTNSDLETCGVRWQQPREGAELVLWFSSAEPSAVNAGVANPPGSRVLTPAGKGDNHCGKHPSPVVLPARGCGAVQTNHK